VGSFVFRRNRKDKSPFGNSFGKTHRSTTALVNHQLAQPYAGETVVLLKLK